MNRLFRYLLPFRSQLYKSSFYSILNKLFDLMPPLLVGWMVDAATGNTPGWISSIAGEKPFDHIYFIGILVVGIFAFESFFQWLYLKGFLSLSQKVQHQLRLDVYEKMQKKEVAFFENNRTGNLISIINDDVNQLETFLGTVFNQILQIIVLLIFSTITFFSVNAQLAVIGLAAVPFIVWGSVYYQRLISPFYKVVRQKVGDLNSRLENNIAGIQVIKSFTSEKFELERVTDASAELKQANMNALQYNAAYEPLIRSFIALGFAGVMVVAGLWVLQGKGGVTAGQIALFGALVQRLLWPVTDLGVIFDRTEKARASANRIFGLMDAPVSIENNPESKTFNDLKTSIKFNNVHFEYMEEGQKILQDIELSFPASKTTGIAGPTGAGKTSLVKLLLRFYDPQSGSITFDGTDIRNFTLQSLRQKIAWVSQDVYLFHGTIYENIAYGRSGATPEEIQKASQKAALHDFVVSLPEGYQTIVGERGIKLSGGQRQRLSIARAILKDAPIIILDEATSAVDTETESIIRENLQLLTQNKTAIIIAHRLSTLLHADNILVMEDGRITESGSHSTLLQKKGLYAQLWEMQAGN